MLSFNKKILISIPSIFLLISFLSVSTFAAVGYSLFVNGFPINGEAKVINGVTYVPMRSVIEKLGGTYHVMPDLNRISILGKDLSMYGGHSKFNPLDSGSKGFIAINRGNDKFMAEISISGMSTGRDAWKDFEQLSSPAPKGYLYYFVKVNFKVLTVEKPGTKVAVNFYDFNYVDSKTQEIITSIPNLHNQIELKAGESFNDWIGFVIKEDEPIKNIFYSKSGDKTEAIWMKV